MDPKTGGVSQAVRTMAEGLTNSGWQNEIVSLDAPDAPFLAQEKTIIHSIGPGISPWQYSKRLHTWFFGNLSRFDVVIVHGLWLYPGYATRKGILRLRESAPNGCAKLPRLFVMPHGMLDPYFQHASGRKLKALRNLIIWKLIENSLISEADGVLFTCLTECKLAQVPFRPYSPKREYVVGLGNKVPPVYSSVMHLALLNKCPGVEGQAFYLFLSRIHEKKGVDLLVNAYKIAFDKCNNIPKLLIAGPGMDSLYGQDMQRLV
jgi:glycosyltransferase involved in cell wall biosynthesis